MNLRVTLSREKLEDEGWAFSRKETGEEGWFPADFCQELPSSSQQDCWQQVQLDTQMPSTSQQELQADPEEFDSDDQRQGIKRVWVDNLRYSQPSMSDRFRDARELEKTIRELQHGNPLYPPFPLLEVAKINPGGYYLSNDHRRLYCLRELQKRSGRWVETRVKVIAEVHDERAFQNLCDRYNPANGGRDIVIRRRRSR